MNKPKTSTDRMPLTILTGFLGAGKTTLLNRYLQTREAEGTAVLVNEFGAVDVDGAVLGATQTESRLMKLPNGCVCCEVQEDLAAAIIDLGTSRETSGVRQCVIETTGLAEPGSILRGLAHDPRLRLLVTARQTLTVASAKSTTSELQRFAEAASQVALADRIVVTKSDIVPADDLSRAMLELATRNPLATIDIAEETAHVAELFCPPPLENGLSRTQSAAARHEHTHGIASFSVPLAAPLDPDLFRDVMLFWIMRHSEKLLRIKGVLRFQGEPTARLLNVVHDVADIVPVEIEGDSSLVFIGFDLPEQEIVADLCRCIPS